MSKDKEYSKDDIVEEIERITKTYCDGDIPSSREFKDHAKMSYSVLHRRFGSWEKAIKSCSFEKSLRDIDDIDVVDSSASQSKYSKEELLNNIIEVSKGYCNGEPPSWREMEEYGIDPETFQYRFGISWSELLSKIGFNRNIRREAISDAIYYYGSSWRKQKQRALMRDDYSCAVCDSEQEIDVHHITPVRYWNIQEEHEQMNDLDNLVVLCRKHHQQLEGEYKGRGYGEFVLKAVKSAKK
jgi:hypothetical protein